MKIEDMPNLSKVMIPKELHFIWIGSFDELNTDYIKIWAKVNNNYNTNIWMDEKSSFCHIFNKSLNKYAEKNGLSSIIEIRNSAFNYIYDKVVNGFSFNVAANEFLKISKIPVIKEEKKIKSNYYDFEYVKRDIQVLFENINSISFKKYYYYELILRGNLACASDIIRLLILLNEGGMYIDVDTLPLISPVFIKTNNYLNENKIDDNEYIELAKSDSFVNFFYNKDIESKEAIIYLKNTNLTSSQQYDVFSLISQDLKKANVDMIPKLGDIYVYNNYLLLSTIKNLKAVFFNNIIISVSGSKFIKCILSEIKSNYTLLEQSNCLYCFEPSVRYPSEICSYRSNSRLTNIKVTMSLTGPQLIFNLLIEESKKVLKLDNDADIHLLACFLQKNETGFSFEEQTLDTPMGLNSSWR